MCAPFIHTKQIVIVLSPLSLEVLKEDFQSVDLLHLFFYFALVSDIMDIPIDVGISLP